MSGSNESLHALAAEVDHVRDDVREARERADRIEGKLQRLALLVGKAAPPTACLAFVELVAARGPLSLPA